MKSLAIHIACIALLLAGSRLTLVAQDAAKPAGNGLEATTLTGTLEAVAADKIRVKGEDGTSYFVVLNRQSTVSYRGTADPRFLRPGLMVRFSGTFNTATGTPEAPIAELEIFRPVKRRRMSREMQQNQTPGIYPVAAKGEAGEGRANPRTQPRTANAASKNPELKIVGQLRAVQADKIQVVAGNRPVIVPMDAAVKISVGTGDTMFCMPGDTVEVVGLTNSAQPSWIQAETVEITGVNVLGQNENPGQSKKPGQAADARGRRETSSRETKGTSGSKPLNPSRQPNNKR